MRVNKPQALMYIFEALITLGNIQKKDELNELEISDLTFKRYMQEIRAYIYNFNKDYELVYDYASQNYYLKKLGSI